MRVLVCGGRDFFDKALVNEALDRLHATKGIDLIIQGGAQGADMLAAEWGWNHGIPVGTYNADWKKYGRAAGPLRNRQMIDEGKPDGVVAFQGGIGTKDMVEQAQSSGLTVWFPR